MARADVLAVLCGALLTPTVGRSLAKGQGVAARLSPGADGEDQGEKPMRNSEMPNPLRQSEIPNPVSSFTWAPEELEEFEEYYKNNPDALQEMLINHGSDEEPPPDEESPIDEKSPFDEEDDAKYGTPGQWTWLRVQAVEDMGTRSGRKIKKVTWSCGAPAIASLPDWACRTPGPKTALFYQSSGENSGPMMAGVWTPFRGISNSGGDGDFVKLPYESCWRNWDIMSQTLCSLRADFLRFGSTNHNEMPWFTPAEALSISQLFRGGVWDTDKGNIIAGQLAENLGRAEMAAESHSAGDFGQALDATSLPLLPDAVELGWNDRSLPRGMPSRDECVKPDLDKCEHLFESE
eukprot:CAMPEP_0198500844 /NCGR_PEP_ID=MMETSP1462-20131121/8372_1 /TAXON_ID=1333877 /ORGANISM="Brandtodinium nutriculum, Strain RCC3387" /LENGTH=348 /DNA_ID=CAMNT_0044229863 /DNA_START=60 /DNA_END=1106 /DNA_ORIENTATION=-